MAKFNSIEMARKYLDRCTSAVGIIMGCDGLYWVPYTGKAFSKLVAGGYEAVK